MQLSALYTKIYNMEIPMNSHTYCLFKRNNRKKRGLHAMGKENLSFKGRASSFR